jgi:hypothetical protein
MAKGRVVLLHFIAQMPMAGIAWQALQYLVGLQKLGYDTWYIENHGANPYDPRANSVMMDCSYNVAFLKDSIERFGFKDRWAYWDAINDVYHGLSRERVRELYAGADGLINLCGATRLRDEHMRCPVRIIVDTDPVYEQIKYAQANPDARAYVDAHTHFFTYGENLGTTECSVPLSGVPWQPTRPPVDLDLWPKAEGAPPCFTTVATWENKGKNIDFEGTSYVWSKHINFLAYLDLPRQRPQTCFRIAMLPPDEGVRRVVEGAGWQLADPRPVSADMESYQAFIAGSRGEFTVAKDIYVRPNSGWFSDRAVCYLASGRPIVTMRTGFDRLYPAGRGLFDYGSRDEALAAIDAIAVDYGRHSNAAREVAGEIFGAERVISRLLADAGL